MQTTMTTKTNAYEQAQQLLDFLRNAQNGSTLAVDHNQADAEQTGLYIHPALELSYDPHSGMGLACATAVAANTLLLRFPKELHLRVDSMIANPISGLLATEDKWISLVLLMLFHHSNVGTLRSTKNISTPDHNSAQGHAFHHQLLQLHLQSMPTDYHQPFLWDSLKELEGVGFTQHSPLIDLQSDWQNKIQPFLQSNSSLFPAIPTFEDFQIAVAQCLSRGFRSMDSQYCLLPLVDFANTHFPSHINVHHSWENGIFYLRTDKDINAQEELFLQYGEQIGNAEWCQRYGFVIDNTGSLNESITTEDLNEISSQLDIEMCVLIFKEEFTARMEEMSQQRKKRKLGTGTSESTTNEDTLFALFDAIDDCVEEMTSEFFPISPRDYFPIGLYILFGVFLEKIPVEDYRSYINSLAALTASPEYILSSRSATAMQGMLSDSAEWSIEKVTNTWSTEDWLAFYMSYLQIASVRLSEFPTTYDEDHARFKSLSPSNETSYSASNIQEKLALVVRLNEKKAVMNAIGECQRRLSKVMESTEDLDEISEEEDLSEE